MSQSGGDAEIHAIEQVIGVLEPLDRDARSRVLDYAFKRLGISGLPGIPVDRSAAADIDVVGAPEPEMAPVAVDIRSLRDEKQPRSANDMAAVVAYYLADLAPPGDRKREIGKGDIEKYFKQAGHPLPKAPDATLRNAAAAGYFDSSARGLFSLNPVGHNLVAHGLPRTGSDASSRTRKKRSTTSSATKAQRKIRKPTRVKRQKKK